MIKRTIREVVCEYDENGRLINKTETVTEEEDDNKYNPWSSYPPCPVCTSGYITTADASEAQDCKPTSSSCTSTTSCTSTASDSDEDDDLLSWLDKVLDKIEREIKEMNGESDTPTADKALKGRERVVR